MSLHSAWPKTDPFLRTVVEGWQVMAKGLVFEDCTHAAMYESVPDFNAQTLAFLQRHSG